MTAPTPEALVEAIARTDREKQLRAYVKVLCDQFGEHASADAAGGADPYDVAKLLRQAWPIEEEKRPTWIVRRQLKEANIENQRLTALLAEAKEMLVFFLGEDGKVEVRIAGNPAYINERLNAARDLLARIGGSGGGK